MSDKSIVKLVLITGATFVVIFLTINYFSLQREITIQDKQTERVQMVEQETTERALKVEDKETERVEAIQEEKTNRTEKRAKAWNFPWNQPAVYDGTNLGVQK